MAEFNVEDTPATMRFRCVSGLFHTWNMVTLALPLLQVPLPGPLRDHAAPGPGSPPDGGRLTTGHGETSTPRRSKLEVCTHQHVFTYATKIWALNA